MTLRYKIAALIALADRDVPSAPDLAKPQYVPFESFP